MSRKMRSRRLTSGARLLLAAAIAAILSLGAAFPDEKADVRPSAGSVTVLITHRVFVDFRDTLTVAMNERHVVGDTEYTFELVEFYPDFAIDTTKKVMSRSDEPRNPAFRVAVYEKDEKADDTWAFYGIDIPHFGRTSYLAFKVLAFEYRGEMIGNAGGTPAPQSRKEEKQQ